jgi:hypothetical protein
VLSDYFSGMRPKFEARGGSPSVVAKQAEYMKSDSAPVLNNVFRVRLGKILKNINSKF